jgi:hypothetical protein
MRKLVAPASAVTVYTAIAASTINIHTVIAAAACQYSFGINKMHRIRFLSFISGDDLLSSTSPRLFSGIAQFKLSKNLAFIITLHNYTKIGSLMCDENSASVIEY